MHAFISYSRSTPFLGESMKALIEANGYGAWLDLDDIPGGALWEKKIFEAVEQSFVMVLIVTRPALQSQWIRREIEVAKQQNREIVPLIFERLDSVDDSLKQLGISEYQAIDFVTLRRVDAEAQLLGAIEAIYMRCSGILPFLPKLTSNSKTDQIFVIRQIGRSGDKSSIAASYVIPFLQNPDWDIRYEAVEALIGVADESAIEPLIELIREGQSHPAYTAPLSVVNEWITSSDGRESWHLRIQISTTVDLATLLLGWIGSRKASPFLRRLASASDTLAIRSLGYLRDPGSVDLLGKILSDFDGNFTLAFACIWALGRIGMAEGAEKIDNWLRQFLPIDDPEDIEYTDISGVYEKDATQLWDDLNVPHYLADDFIADLRINVVAAAMIVLGMLGDTSVVGTLIEILNSTRGDNDYPDALTIHCAAALALGLLGDNRALPTLHELECFYIELSADDSEPVVFDHLDPEEFVIEAIKMIEGS